MRIALYDSGIGGLAALRESLLVVPDADWLYVADEDFFPAGGRPGPEVRARLSSIAMLLRELSVDVVIPAASFAWPHLSALSEGLRVINPLPALRTAVYADPDSTVVGIVAPPSVIQSAIPNTLAAGRTAVTVSSYRLAGVVENSSEPTDLLVAVVRETVRPFAPSRVSLVIPLDSHAAWVPALLKRFSGGVQVLDTPAHLAEALATAVWSRSGPAISPRVTVLAPRSYMTSVRDAVRARLQVSGVSVRPLPLSRPPPTSPRGPTDVALLAYAAFDAQVITELTRLVAPGARHLGTGRDLLPWLEDQMERSDCRHVIEHVFPTGEDIGITGLRAGLNGQSTPFAHRLRVHDGLIATLETSPVAL